MAGKPNPYPKVPSRSWAELRQRAADAPTFKITGDTVAALLGMSNAKSALDNIVYPLRRLGLIDEDGALTGRGGKWRTDGGYAEACTEILDDIYPESLSHLAGDSGAVKTWFDQQGFGSSNAQQMARTYLMIESREVPELSPPSGNGPKKSPAKKAPAKKVVTKQSGSRSDDEDPKPGPSPSRPSESPPQPSLHLDIQIHIPPDASAEQLDKIFESMAKHLYNR